MGEGWADLVRLASGSPASAGAGAAERRVAQIIPRDVVDEEERDEDMQALVHVGQLQPGRVRARDWQLTAHARACKKSSTASASATRPKPRARRLSGLRRSTRARANFISRLTKLPCYNGTSAGNFACRGQASLFAQHTAAAVPTVVSLSRSKHLHPHTHLRRHQC